MMIVALVGAMACAGHIAFVYIVAVVASVAFVAAVAFMVAVPVVGRRFLEPVLLFSRMMMPMIHDLPAMNC